MLDAREAFINAVVDALSAYMLLQNSLPQLSLLAPTCLNMLPAYTHAVLRSPGFRSDLKVKLDERVQFMNEMKCLPLGYLIQSVYSDLYAIHDIANTVRKLLLNFSADSRIQIMSYFISKIVFVFCKSGMHR